MQIQSQFTRMLDPLSESAKYRRADDTGPACIGNYYSISLQL